MNLTSKSWLKRLWIPGVTVKVLVVGRLIAGCSSSGTPAPPAATPLTDAGSTPTYTGPTVTYYKDVKPIFDAKCATMCHHDGGIAPFSLTEYGGALDHKDAIATATANKVMPPWPPSDTCTEYLGDRSLTADQITAIGNWVAGGAVEGDPADFVPLQTTPGTGLSHVDATLTMPVSYVPTKSPDDYRCFVLDWNETTTKYVTGFGTRPGQPTIVHHSLVYVAPPNQVATYQAYDDAEAGPGYTCFGGPMGESAGADAGEALTLPNQIGGWVPGELASDYPQGTGIKIDPGSKVILQIHYNTLNAPPVADVTSLDMALADTVTKPAFIIPWVNPAWVKGGMKIAPQDPDATYSFAYDGVQGASFGTGGALSPSKPLTIYSAAGHMHLHGTKTELSIIHADQSSECMLDIEHWNFHWQGGFGFSTPKTLNPGEKLNIECHWDNTDANQPSFDGVQQPAHELNWGEKTTDEMCIGFMYVTQ